MLKQIKKDLQKLKNLKHAKLLSRFFKTGKGEYGEGDIFLGLNVPQLRIIAKKYPGLNLKEQEELVKMALSAEKYQKSDEKEKKEIFDFYLRNTKNINNWDLIDLSSNKILGDYLIDKNKSILYKLAKSKSLWEKRIAVIATFTFIANNKFSDTLKISEILLNDKHDLIHKAVGWMLREVGKRNLKVEEKFLKKHYKKMPRTMLRYAIEKFDENKRRFYLAK